MRGVIGFFRRKLSDLFTHSGSHVRHVRGGAFLFERCYSVSHSGRFCRVCYGLCVPDGGGNNRGHTGEHVYLYSAYCIGSHNWDSHRIFDIDYFCGISACRTFFQFSDGPRHCRGGRSILAGRHLACGSAVDAHGHHGIYCH